MQIPTAADLRAITQINWAGLGYGTPVPTPDPLEDAVTLAVAVIETYTGRDLSALDDASPEAILARRLIPMMVVWLETPASTGYGAAGGYYSEIQSFSVPGYSETRKTSENVGDGRSWYFVRWPALDDLLWLLATDEKKALVLAEAGGKEAPAIGFMGDGPTMLPLDTGWPLDITGWRVHEP